MLTRWLAAFMCLSLASAAQAAALRVSAEPPLSAQRLGDALRSYVDGAEVTVAAGPADFADGASAVVLVTLRHGAVDDADAELELRDGEVTMIARLPGALRVEDLYRTAALKVQSLLGRRPVNATPDQSMASVHAQPTPGDAAARDRLWLDAGLAVLLPSGGPPREGLRLGAGLRLAERWRLGLGAYLEPPRSTHPQGIDVSAWELPIWLSLGFAWHHGPRWVGWLDAVGHLAVRRISVESPGIVANSATTLSPRVGGTLGAGVTLGPGLRAEARVSVLAALVDTRYRVDGQVVWPSAPALLLVELGIAYGLY